jgi:hypothetical protein
MNLIFLLKNKVKRRWIMKKEIVKGVFNGYLVRGDIRGQGAPYLMEPSCEWCTIEEVEVNGEIYYRFYIDGKLIMTSKHISGETWDVETDSWGNRNFWGEYWDYISPEEMKFLYEEVLGEGETLADWLREKYVGWGI